ncbi:hypothetical protein GW17_00046539, partial [Ensete ventricosum]
YLVDKVKQKLGEASGTFMIILTRPRRLARSEMNLKIGNGARVATIVVGEVTYIYLDFAEGIEKLAGNTPGDYRKKTIRLAVRMLEVASLAGVANDG